ncbi:SDR family oxidoreductase [Asticcacaulis sp. EMRT-3]|uniref:SDR family NAD(P)-dependent oxidoreductase n=1 Tax=Asticcacaulis sp. EMRT-3 TaxID=3040349 RepID=UPI0024AECE97|nr:SDR family oxidoreductase [Asticcacaulis sp. EMRT-3]MDI7775091.1 SDR family oxidoreductase [Asticcacaulis sp. EMRT-3]
MRFKDKVIIITGGLGGIGLACARQFACEGANLMLVEPKAAPDNPAIDDLQSLGAPAVVMAACDVSVEAEVVAACATALHRFGRLDVVVNVAGAMIYKPIIDLTGADWQHYLGVNLMGAVHFTREAFRHMKAGGAIVNVSSIHAFQTSANVAPYAAAKAALTSLTRTAAIEGKPLGIRANAVLPGAIDTPMLWASPNIQSGAEVLLPEDVGQPENIAAAVAFLASPEAAFITGSSLVADGGRLAKL